MPVALSLLGLYALLFPGGDIARTAWETLGAALLWFTPVVLLVAVALRWPSLAVVVLVIGVALFVGTGIWYVLDPAGWRAWEGPDALRAVFAMYLMTTAAVLGLRRRVEAALLLLIIGIVLPVSMALVGVTWGEFTNGPEAGVSIVSTLAGVLYGLSEFTERLATQTPVHRRAPTRSKPA